MKFTILRQLTHSELGMFHAYRDGREGSKQRAINFDWDVVDRVFPSAKDSDRIHINCRCMEDETTVIEKSQSLRRQGKNWRLEGYCPKSPYFKFVEPGVLFAMSVDASTSPAVATWIVIPKSHPAHQSIVNHGESARLAQSGMIALFGHEGAHSTTTLGQHFPTLFCKSEVLMPPQQVRETLEPDPVGLFDILARAGHRLPSAVADLVDNSISAGATQIDITFPNPNDGGRWMCIRDNGSGMGPEGLRNAMRVGNQRIYEGGDLGKFGYGLKGASWSQSDCMTVVTRSADGTRSTMTWDRDHLALTREWNVLEDEVGKEYETVTTLHGSGTAVLLTKMRPPAVMPIIKNVDPYTVEVTSIREHLELVFHRYLDGVVPGLSKVAIFLNGEPLNGNDPMGHVLTKAYDPRSLTLNDTDPAHKSVIVVRAFIMPNEDELDRHHGDDAPEAARRARERISLNGRWNETQGFYFYRLNRLIKWGGWENLFAMDEKTKLIRVAVDFDRTADDSMQVNISKQEIKLPVSMADHLKDLLKQPRAEGRARYKMKAINPSSTIATPQPNAGRDNGGQPILPPLGRGSKPRGTTLAGGGIRLVDSGSSPWTRKRGFTGEHVEVTPIMPALVELVRAIDTNPEAKVALSKFLLVLEDADVLKMLTNA